MRRLFKACFSADFQVFSIVFRMKLLQSKEFKCLHHLTLFFFFPSLARMERVKYSSSVCSPVVRYTQGLKSVHRLRRTKKKSEAGELGQCCWFKVTSCYLGNQLSVVIYLFEIIV